MTEKPKSAGHAAAKDERNLVAADAGATAPALEERMHEFWKNNRTGIVVVVLLALAIVLGREGWQWYSASHEQSIRAAYRAAATVEAKLSFARANPGHPLAGLAWLAAADDAYKNTLYDQAARYYADARKVLEDPTLIARARLGEGMAALQANRETEGKQMLQALGDDAQIPKAMRAEAWYHLAAGALAGGATADAQQALDKITAIDPEGTWAMRGGMLHAQLPATESPAAAVPQPETPGEPAAPEAPPPAAP